MSPVRRLETGSHQVLGLLGPGAEASEARWRGLVDHCRVLKGEGEAAGAGGGVTWRGIAEAEVPGTSPSCVHATANSVYRAEGILQASALCAVTYTAESLQRQGFGHMARSTGCCGGLTHKVSGTRPWCGYDVHLTQRR